MTTAWTSHDHEALGAVRGDPAFQAAWEAFALLIAVYTWQTDLLTACGPLTVHGDAQGVLHAVVAQRACNPLLNLIVAEIQLVLGPTAHSITAVGRGEPDL